MISIAELYHGEYMNATDIASRGEVKARITAARLIEVYNQEKRETVQKLGLALHGWPRMMVVNATNARMIAQTLGDDAEKWVGSELTIVAGRTRGKDTIIVKRVTRATQPAKQAQPAAPKADTETGELIYDPPAVTIPTIEDLRARTAVAKCAVMCQEWAAALAELADTCVYWQNGDGQPNGNHALKACAKFGYAQITRDNVLQVVTDLRFYGTHRMEEQERIQADLQATQ